MGDGVNRVTLLGNLGADPEIKIPRGGQALMSLRMATNETYIDKDNQRQQRVEWHRITIWGRRAEGLAKILKKGDTLYIEGRLQTRSWDKNGEKRYSTEIVASTVILPGTGTKGGERPASSPRPSQVAAARARREAQGAGRSEDDYDDYGDAGDAGGSSAPAAPPAAPKEEDDIPF